jgi:hypothetical protein
LAADTAFWQLYDSSFPSSEREPRSVMMDNVRKGSGFAIRARAHSRTVGLATADLLRELPVVFMVYLAVVPEFQSNHIGTTLFEMVWAMGCERYSEWGLSPKGMVWEVEMPERASVHQDLEKHRGRIDFFARLGAHVLLGPYVQPPVDGITSVPMHLMFWTALGCSLPDGSELSELIHTIYFETVLSKLEF